MKKLTTIIALVVTLTLAGCAKKENKQESKKEYKQEVLKKEEVKEDKIDQELQLHIKNTMEKFDDIWERDWKNAFATGNLTIANNGMDNGILEYQNLITELQDDFYRKNDDLKSYSDNMIQASNHRINAMQMVKEGISNGSLKDQMETIKSTVDKSSENMLMAVPSAIKAGYK